MYFIYCTHVKNVPYSSYEYPFPNTSERLPIQQIIRKLFNHDVMHSSDWNLPLPKKLETA